MQRSEDIFISYHNVSTIVKLHLHKFLYLANEDVKEAEVARKAKEAPTIHQFH